MLCPIHLEASFFGDAGMIRLLAVLLAFWAGTTIAAEPQSGTDWTDPATGIAFVWLAGGTYEMGCRSSEGACSPGDSPLQTRRIAGFWMSRTEVTREQWGRLMQIDPSVKKQPSDYPVDQVHWEEAQDFLSRLNKTGHGKFRLPTEAEWEYACRGGKAGESYCGGNDLEALAWYIRNSKRSAQPVGQKRPNGFGLYDMSGNLWEWTQDCWSESLPQGVDGKAYEDKECASRVLRGGSWGAYPAQLRASSRRSDTDVKCPYIGLRLVRSPD